MKKTKTSLKNKKTKFNQSQNHKTLKTETSQKLLDKKFFLSQHIFKYICLFTVRSH